MYTYFLFYLHNVKCCTFCTLLTGNTFTKLSVVFELLTK